MYTPGKGESEKSSAVLDIDSFDKPREIDNITSWSESMLNLIFLSPGSYPSIPDMGVGIQRYEYEFADDMVSKIRGEIIRQHQKYLSDIPLSATTVTIEESALGEKVVLIKLAFTDRSGEPHVSAIVTPAEGPRRFIDQEISW